MRQTQQAPPINILNWLTRVSTAVVLCGFTALTLHAEPAIAAPVITFSILHSFDSADGSVPDGALVQGTDGNFYGTTSFGGTYNDGAVFRISPEGALTTLHNFDRADGYEPLAGLFQANDGNFYGTTFGGGANDVEFCGADGGCGTVFQLTPAGTLTTLYSFCSKYGNHICKDGYEPEGTLVQATDGNLYGTTAAGGPIGEGTIFKISLGGTLTTIHTLAGTDGAYTSAGLVYANDGNFYGTASEGGADRSGTVFKITPSGTLTILHAFEGTDGNQPKGGLTLAANGDFYGTTFYGGANNNSLCDDSGCGTVFKITPSGNLTTLYNFCSQYISGNCTDGANPQDAVTQAADGKLYGTTFSGGINHHGTVFKINANGVLTTLMEFDGTDGYEPASALIQATSGIIYGTTNGGGANNEGEIFTLSLGLGSLIATHSSLDAARAP